MKGLDWVQIPDYVCAIKCIVPSQHGGILNSHRAACPLVKLMDGEERRDASDQPQGVHPQNWDGAEQNRSVNRMVLIAKAKDRRKSLALSHDEFRGP
ncbi:uncharacterized protein TNCV_1031651 [Trichonephila clavipes]|nr:uncharacterized protein TNCV_1031651 [Trichonephila clavipes]